MRGRPHPSGCGFLAWGGEIGTLMRVHDWSPCPLGHPETWTGPLRSVVCLMLASKLPIFVAWGAELTLLYNDSYRPILGAKHPEALGSPLSRVWAEIWPDIEPLAKRVLAGEALLQHNVHVAAERDGQPEDLWYTLSYNPIREEDGTVAGIFCAGTETTAQMRAEAALRESEEHLDYLVDINPQTLWSADPEGHVRQVNRQNLAQLVPEETVGMGWVRSVHPDDLPHTIEAWQHAIRTGEPYDVQHRVCFYGEVYRWMRSRASPRRDESGRIIRWYGNSEDIHDRKLAEQALRESETRFRNMAEHAPVTIWMTDPSGCLTYVNGRWSDLSGQTEAEALGAGWLDATHPDDLTRVKAVFAAANAEREPFEVEYRFRAADGTYHWAIDTAAPRFDDGGRFLGHVGSMTDITERKLVEEAIRRREKNLRNLANTVPAFVWFAGPDSSVHYLNNRWYEYTGQTPEQALPHGWLDAIHPDDRERTAEAWASACAEGMLYEMENRYRRSDGLYRWYLSRAEPVRDETTGQILRWFGAGIDVDDQKRIEERQNLLIHELNHRVKNTLATVQSIAAQTLRNVPDPEHAKEAFEGRLIALSRAHDVLTRENWEGANLDEIVAQAIEPYRSYGESRLHLGGPFVRLSPRMALALAMAFQELATNAVKYGALSNATGEIWITWEVECGASPCVLRLRWEESGGPPVTPPTRRGFGTRLIERSLGPDLGGTIRVDFAPTGLVCTVAAPFDGA